MKKIYLTTYNQWTDVEPSENEIKTVVKVPNDVSTGILNSLAFYRSDEYSAEEYAAALARRQVAEAKSYLADTDYVATQWAEEQALGIDHNRTEEEYMEILKKRQDAREVIRNIV